MKASDKNNPFKTPDSYFDKFSDILSKRLREENIEIPKEDGFILPEGYLEDLHSNIQKKLEYKENKVVPLNPYKTYYLIAASIAALVLFVFGLNWNTGQEIPSWDDIANTDIENYFDNNYVGLTSLEIAEVMSIEDLEITDFLNSELSEEHIVDYLNDYIDDFEELNLEEDE
jgi:hypothetical protein